MKRLTRGPAPEPLGDAASDAALRREWYADLRNELGLIRPRWNRTIGGEQPIRKAVNDLSAGECTWCGDLVAGPSMQVDHYLPKERFPRLAYCWAVLFPSCGPCNLRKSEYAPAGLARDSLYDPVLHPQFPSERPYTPESVLDSRAERLVEPSFDDPADHLRFHPELAAYECLTPAGNETEKRFFNQRTDAERLVKLQAHVRHTVKTSTSQQVLDHDLAGLIELIGRSFYVEAFAACWLELDPPDWTKPEP